MKRRLTLAVVVALVVGSVTLLAGPTLHLKYLKYDNSRMLAPGVGIYYLGTTDWSYGLDLSFAYMTFESSPETCSECDDAEWRLTIGGMWDLQVYYDIPIGGCDPGPCDMGAFRIGAGIAVPAYLGISNIEGFEVGADEIGGVLSLAYVWDSLWGLKDAMLKGELYYAGEELGYGLSFHVDLFSLGDLIRGHDVVTDVGTE